MKRKMLSAILKTIDETLSILAWESEVPRLCISMQRHGSIGKRLSFRSTSLEECRLMFRMIAIILFCVLISKKSIIFKTKVIAPLVRIAWGFSIDIFSRALMQASLRSINPILRSRTCAKHFTPPCVTMLLQMFGKISMRFVRHWMANTIKQDVSSAF